MASIFPRAPSAFIGKHIRELPTPPFILSRPVMERNARTMLRHVAKKKLAFRPHVKTLKVPKLMLGPSHNKVIVSTLREAWGLLHEGVAKEINPLRDALASGCPFPDLSEVSRHVKTILLIDHDTPTSMSSKPSNPPTTL
ncbi:hypothetical protein QBC35DRAFT_541805 [Podospora australis]|uniref:Uncharacterized protein n=1 Tax=Podospora australis TaxID=1536484 RepID=A0AAN6WKT7_9PEZI|nr:hypothetical protein QBC35DRAFT_541805 [Podospora australis]